MASFYFDEDSSQHRLIAALRSHLIDVVSSLEVGMNSRDDEAHLIYAHAQGRVLVSYNVSDFAILHRQWIEQGRSHSGILLVQQQRYSVGEFTRRLLRISSGGYAFRGGIFYLSNF